MYTFELYCWLCPSKDYLLSLKNKSDKGRRGLAQGQILDSYNLRSKDFQLSVSFPMTRDNLLRNNSYISCKHELSLKNLFFPPNGKMFWYFMKFQPSAETDHLPKYLWSLGTN